MIPRTNNTASTEKYNKISPIMFKRNENNIIFFLPFISDIFPATKENNIGNMKKREIKILIYDIPRTFLTSRGIMPITKP